MSSYSAQRFFSYIEKNNLLDAQTLEATKIGILKSEEDPEDYFRQKHLLTEENLLQARAFAMQVEYINLSNRAASPQALALITEGVARQYTIFPFEFDPKENSIKVATDQPLNLENISFLEKKTGRKIIPYLAAANDIVEAIDIQYRQNISPTVTSALEEFSTRRKTDAFDAQKKKKIIVKEPPIAKIVNTILEFAVRSRASDIHIEPQDSKTRVRYRIDGILYEKLILPSSLHESLVSRIKILSQMRIDEKRIPQDGRFTFTIGDQEDDLRVSTLPTVHGEKIVMRLLKKTGGIPSLPDLGLRDVALKSLETEIAKPYGIVLITGPTGSGKTTTLYSVLTRLNQATVNIMTLEDPVEYEIAGINQVQVNPQAGLTFANGLRSFLRQDPNIILVGEIRDQETTSLAIQAALTGHLVFSTLHTNDSATAIHSLLDLGAEPFLIASILNAAIAQRIVRRICSSCKYSFAPDKEVDNAIRTTLGHYLPNIYRDKPLILYKGKGCSECQGTGYFGRIGIYEILVVNNAINKLVLQRANAANISQEARKNGMIIMQQDGYLKVLDGLTTVEEILRVSES